MIRAFSSALSRCSAQLNAKFAGSSSAAAPAAGARRSLSDGAKHVEEHYAKSLSVMHWLIAAGFTGCVATVNAQNFTEDKKTKGLLMNAHKSFGVLMAGLALPRVALRLTTKIPKALPGHQLEHFAASASHVAMYGMLIFMPFSGVAMGYFGGKGLPFFGMHIPGAETPNGAIAKQAYKNHKLAGQALEYFLLPAHVAGAGLHFIRGHKVFARINPFR